MTVDTNWNWVEVSVYANSTLIGTQLVGFAYGIATVSFVWNATGFTPGFYTLRAVMPVYPTETNVTDNSLTAGGVYVTKLGDVTGDGCVNVLDLIVIATSLFSYNPTADINHDHKVNVLDLIIVARHLGT